MQSPSISQDHPAPVPGAELLDFIVSDAAGAGWTIGVVPGSCGRGFAAVSLDHVNIYFVDDGKGWALIDTGMGDEATLAAWQPLLDTVLRDRPLTRIIATHFHPDHVGAAGFLLQRFNVPL